MKNQVLLDNLKSLPMLVKNIFNSTDTSPLNLDINKTQEAILMSVNTHQEKAMCQISKYIGLEKSSYTRSVEILLEKGFLEKTFFETDKRKIKLILTEKGRNAAIEIDKVMDKHLDNILENFSQNEHNEFIQALKVVSKYSYKISDNKNGGTTHGTSY